MLLRTEMVRYLNISSRKTILV